MKRKWHILTALLFGGMLSSCVYSYDDLPDSTKNSYPVLEGSIIIGDKATLSCGWTTGLDRFERNQEDPASLVWYVEDSEGDRYEPVSGIVDMRVAPADRSYRIHVELLDKEYESDWQTALDPPEIGEIRFAADESRVTVLTDFTEAEESTGYITYSIEETWEFHVPYVADYSVNPETWQVSVLMEQDLTDYYCWKTQNTQAENLMDMTHLSGRAENVTVNSYSRSDSRNHRNYSILVKARTLSEKEYKYRYNQLRNITGGNDLFTPNPGDLPGNISCLTDPDQLVYGYVSLSRIAQRRAYMGNRFLISTPPGLNGFVILTPDQYPVYYMMGYRPVKLITLDEVTGIGWAPLRCINCLADGGTHEIPECFRFP